MNDKEYICAEPPPPLTIEGDDFIDLKFCRGILKISLKDKWKKILRYLDDGE